MVLKEQKKENQIIFEAKQVEARRELEKAEQALKEADEELQSIKPADISEIASYASLSHLNRRIIEGSLILRKLKVNP
jgi:hypothetical protein